jgi:hypothetical protein
MRLTTLVMTMIALSGGVAALAGGCFFEPELLPLESGGGGTGGTQCNAVNCPSDDCNQATCVDQKCLQSPREQGTPCQASNGGPGTCNAAGVCGSCSNGQQDGAETGVDCGPQACGLCNTGKCGSANDCKSGWCADQVCCDAACNGKCEGCTQALTGKPDGTCAAIQPGMPDVDFPACAPLGSCGAVAGFCLCEDGVLSPGETDIDCGGVCGNTCTLGQKCTNSADCAGGSPCVDGVCCASACGAACTSCNSPGKEGLCAFVYGKDLGQCDGAKACNLLGGCASATGQSCNADKDCATGLCDNGMCTDCNAATGCPAGNTCSNGSCWPNATGAIGAPCADGTTCDSGYCVDGVCCVSQCGGKCMACHSSYTTSQDGQCTLMLAGYDPQSECEGPGKAATCSGTLDPNDVNQSSCGQNQ